VPLQLGEHRAGTRYILLYDIGRRLTVITECVHGRGGMVSTVVATVSALHTWCPCKSDSLVLVEAREALRFRFSMTAQKLPTAGRRTALVVA